MKNTPTQKNEDQFGSYHTADDHIEEYSEEENIIDKLVGEIERLPTLNLESFFAETGTEIRGLDNAKKLVDKERIINLLRENYQPNPSPQRQ